MSGLSLKCPCFLATPLVETITLKAFANIRAGLVTYFLFPGKTREKEVSSVSQRAVKAPFLELNCWIVLMYWLYFKQFVHVKFWHLFPWNWNNLFKVLCQTKCHSEKRSMKTWKTEKCCRILWWIMASHDFLFFTVVRRCCMRALASRAPVWRSRVTCSALTGRRRRGERRTRPWPQPNSRLWAP